MLIQKIYLESKNLLMIDFNFEEALTQIFEDRIDPFLDSFEVDDYKKLHELEKKSNEIVNLFKERSGDSFEDIVRNNDVELFQDYINKTDPEQIYSNDEKYGNIFIFRLISLFLEISKKDQEKEKMAQYLQHYLLRIKNLNNLKRQIQLKSLLKQINEFFSNETDQYSQHLIETAKEMGKFSSNNV